MYLHGSCKNLYIVGCFVQSKVHLSVDLTCVQPVWKAVWAFKIHVLVCFFCPHLVWQFNTVVRECATCVIPGIKITAFDKMSINQTRRWWQGDGLLLYDFRTWTIMLWLMEENGRRSTRKSCRETFVPCRSSTPGVWDRANYPEKNIYKPVHLFRFWSCQVKVGT